MLDVLLALVAVGSLVLNGYLIYSQRKKNISSSTLDYAKVNELVQTQMVKLVERYRRDLVMYKKYINYLLKGIAEDKQGKFVPIDLAEFELAQVG